MSGQLRDFLGVIEQKLDVGVDLGEPGGDHTVVNVAPVQGGYVGLDEETGAPVRLDWKYKTIHEKPIIINAGGKQTVLPPPPPFAAAKVQPGEVQLGSEPGPQGTVTEAMGGELYDALGKKFASKGLAPVENWVGARKVFALGCVADPEFYAKWGGKLGLLEPPRQSAATSSGRWPARSNGRRRRTVDT